MKLLDQEWKVLTELCAGMNEEEWARMTDCPGWTVKDQISHIIGTELMLSGQESPEQVVPASGPDVATDLKVSFPYVKNPIGEVNELWVEARRQVPPGQVLDEFQRVTATRLATLRSLSEADFARVGWTPAGQAPYREFMDIRVFDCWVHEQDVRRAIDKPGNLTGEIANHARKRIKSALPYVVGKKARSPEGSLVTFHITRSDEETFAIAVSEGRAAFTEHVPPTPASEIDTDQAYLEMNFETLACLGCGRWDPVASLQNGKVSIAGNVELGTRVLENLNFMI
ncbi:MAG: maleylpyruvate isomerase N-terminal domain-containing protein [Actinobacteria bacterium]|nr:maleylpyruvate isomerase N-terminal domain-containing protein [Actinomycetota bacterium]